MWTDVFLDSEVAGLLDPYPAGLHLLLAGRDRAAEERRLQQNYGQFAPQGLQTVVIGVRVLQALVSQDGDRALDLLGEGLNLGRPEGFVRCFVDCRVALSPLLRQAISRGIEPGYARKLLSIIEAEDRQRRIRKGAISASAATAGLLSERELEVLQLVSDGLSNQQIAQRLTVSLSTAKTHVYHIFDKLDAKDRLQAVKRARELKVL
jgi:LuxR family maltose regulon positive regulatory protein